MKTKNQTRDALESHTNKKSLKKEAHHLPSWGLTDRQICDLELLLNGGFAPLKGFMGKNDYNSVLDNMRLNDGSLWPMPITLDVNNPFIESIAEGDRITLKDNEGFWRKEGKRIDWIKPYKKIKDVKYSKTDVKIRWYYDGTLNASANCIDRHLKEKGEKTAIIWEGDNPKEQKHISYKELHEEVSLMANVLKSQGVKKGNRVTICLLYTSPSPRD